MGKAHPELLRSCFLLAAESHRSHVEMSRSVIRLHILDLDFFHEDPPIAFNYRGLSAPSGSKAAGASPLTLASLGLSVLFSRHPAIPGENRMGGG
jgi:hypothetical protein